MTGPVGPPRPIRTCPTCGKMAYSTRNDAKKAAKRVNPAAHLSVYRCDTGYWHFGKLSPLISRGISTRDDSRAHPPHTTGWADRNPKKKKETR